MKAFITIKEALRTDSTKSKLQRYPDSVEPD